jgi:hypothetical protein
MPAFHDQHALRDPNALSHLLFLTTARLPLKQVASISNRAPLAERQATTQSQRSTGKPSNTANSRICCYVTVSYRLCPSCAGVVSKPAPAPAPKRQQQAWVDVDEQNKDNPLACSEYAESIFNYLNTSEVSPKCNWQHAAATQQQVSSAVQLYCLYSSTQWRVCRSKRLPRGDFFTIGTELETCSYCCVGCSCYYNFCTSKCSFTAASVLPAALHGPLRWSLLGDAWGPC